MINSHTEKLLQKMIDHSASDMYLTVGLAPSVRIGDHIVTISDVPLQEEDTLSIIDQLLNEEQKNELLIGLELNLALEWNQSRFRINIFKQQLHSGLVIRRITTTIPTMESLGLPEIYRTLVMKRRGLIIISSPTGSGKSTSVAAMLGYRNANGSGHILTIEDPIEFVHEHKNCIFTQREVGIDTASYSMALRNAFRQRIDVVVIGEIRDRETMEHAIKFAESGHLCIATLHSNNAYQAVERIVNLFAEEFRKQILLSLSQNLDAIISQKLLPSNKGGLALAVEVLLNVGLMKTLILDGRLVEIRDNMAKNQGIGMQTFDQHLLELILGDTISEETAFAEADNPSQLRLKLRQFKVGNTPSIIEEPPANQSEF